MADLKASVVHIPIFTFEEAQTKYPEQCALIKLYEPTATNEQIALVISTLAFRNPKVILEPVQIMGIFKNET